MVPRSISLPAQLLIAFVGLVVSTTFVLTLFAYRSSLESLEADARRSARVAADERADALVRLLASRQQRAEGFLAAAESLCAEPRRDGRFGWSTDCVQTLMHEFRETERASGVVLLYGGYRLVWSGDGIEPFTVEPPALTRLAWRDDGRPVFRMRATRGRAQLLIEFDETEVAAFFRDRSGLGEDGEVYMADAAGRFLTPARYSDTATPPGAVSAEPLTACRSGASESVSLDYRGVRTIHAFTPMPALGGGCIDAHIAYDEAMAPAEQMRSELINRGIAFTIAGALLSLFAAHWISAPVRRLMMATRAIQAGQFSRPLPVGGPTEVRALGNAISTMADALSQMVTREQSARREAEQANRSKDEFLATVSHELRTPLTAILGWARLMRDAHLDEAGAARALAAIERNAQSQKRLVEDLLDVSRMVRGELQVDRAVVPLAPVIDAAIDAVSPQAAEKGVTIARVVDDPSLAVMGDSQRLQQIAWNLVWNAVKFTASGGHVTVELRRGAGDVELRVSDTGVGITPEFLPHVFDWFRQADVNTTRPQNGLGLGLGLVHRLVDMHGGTVRAESDGKGLGATFIVTLPLQGGSAGTAPAVTAGAAAMRVVPAPPRIGGDLRTVRVLVVDDDAETVQAVRAVLEHAGAAVETAATAADARRELDAWHPDILVSDIAMPMEDGYSLLRSLRAAHVAIPAIALTAFARREDAERALEAGFQVHLPKPVDPAHLVATVADLARPV
jgi:signal transduction histidine kinase